MFKVKNEKTAKEIAKKESLYYGWSIFGDWYVGTSVQLKDIGVCELKN